VYEDSTLVDSSVESGVLTVRLGGGGSGVLGAVGGEWGGHGDVKLGAVLPVPGGIAVAGVDVGAHLRYVDICKHVANYLDNYFHFVSSFKTTIIKLVKRFI